MNIYWFIFILNIDFIKETRENQSWNFKQEFLFKADKHMENLS